MTNFDLIALPSSWSLRIFETIDSTNEEAKRMIADQKSIPAPLVLWAKTQTAGKGRRGRSWISPPGNLYVSIILPASFITALHQLSFVSAVTLCEVLENLSAHPPCHPQCKWPNDVLLNDQKVSGTLIEQFQDHVILGTGVNIEWSPDQSQVSYPTTSLTQEGILIDIEVLLENYLRTLEQTLGVLQTNGFQFIRSLWLNHAKDLHKPIRVQVNDQIIEGIFDNMDREGNLVIRQENDLHKIMLGDVLF